MKPTITGISLNRLKNEVHVQFCESAGALILKSGAETLQMEPLYALFRAALDRETEALDYIRQSALTGQIAEQDRVRDGIFRGFSDTVKGLRNHFDESRRADAQALWNIFLFYGNIAQKTLDAETAAINDFLAEIRLPGNGEAMERLGVQEWAVRLNAENAAFHHLMMARYGEASGKTAHRMKTARVETDRYFRAITAAVELQVLTGAGTPALPDFITELNALVARFKGILAQEIGRKIQLGITN